MDILVALLKSSERIRFQRDCWKIDWISYRFFVCIFHYSLMYPIYIFYVFLLCILVCAHAYMWSLEVNVKCLPQWFPPSSLSLELDVSAILPGQPTTEVLPFLFFPSPVLGLQAHTAAPDSVCSCRAPCGPHPYAANTSSAKPFPLPLMNVFPSHSVLNVTLWISSLVALVS